MIYYPLLQILLNGVSGRMRYYCLYPLNIKTRALYFAKGQDSLPWVCLLNEFSVLSNSYSMDSNHRWFIILMFIIPPWYEDLCRYFKIIDPSSSCLYVSMAVISFQKCRYPKRLWYIVQTRMHFEMLSGDGIENIHHNHDGIHMSLCHIMITLLPHPLNN